MLKRTVGMGILPEAASTCKGTNFNIDRRRSCCSSNTCGNKQTHPCREKTIRHKLMVSLEKYLSNAGQEPSKQQQHKCLSRSSVPCISDTFCCCFWNRITLRWFVFQAPWKKFNLEGPSIHTNFLFLPSRRNYEMEINIASGVNEPPSVCFSDHISLFFFKMMDQMTKLIVSKDVREKK